MTEAVDASNVMFYEKMVDVYPLFFDSLSRNFQEEGEWLSRVLTPYRAVRVLDASCGTGRQAIPLAERGYVVTACDPSHAMLAEARRAARSATVDPDFLQLSFAEVPQHVNSTFDAVLALGNGLCHFRNIADIQQALGALQSVCRPGGVCLVGIKDFGKIRIDRPRFHEHKIGEKDGNPAILFEIWDYSDPILDVTAFVVTLYVTHSWRVESAETHEYMLEFGELKKMAKEVGFRTIRKLSHPSEQVYALER